MDEKLNDKFWEIIDEIKKFRVYGQMTFQAKYLSEEEKKRFGDFAAQHTDLDFINEFVTAVGFKSLDYDWTILNKAQAITSLTSVLHKSMAYNVEMATPEKARESAQRFLDIFPEEKTIYVSNGMFYLSPEGKSSSWNAITDSTLDSGIIAFDRKTIAILWFEDED